MEQYNRKWESFYWYGSMKVPAQIIYAPTKEMAEAIGKSVEPYLEIGDEIIDEQSHKEGFDYNNL